MDLLFFLASNDGLGNLQNTLVSNWIGPAFLIVVAALSIKFIVSRQFRELAGFLGIAAVVALLIFNGGNLFGKNGIFYKIAEGFSNLLTGGGQSVPSGGSGTISFFRNFL